MSSTEKLSINWTLKTNFDKEQEYILSVSVWLHPSSNGKKNLSLSPKNTLYSSKVNADIGQIYSVCDANFISG